MAKHEKRVAGVAVLAVAAALAMSTAPAGAGARTSFHGVFRETSAGSLAGYDIHGSVKMTISSSRTSVKVSVVGLDPGKEYGSHLHNGTCASGGGGHYQDVEGEATVPPNELWLSSGASGLTPNRGGVAHGNGSAPWAARIASESTNAKSVVVHEPGSGVRIACADLR